MIINTTHPPYPSSCITISISAPRTCTRIPSRASPIGSRYPAPASASRRGNGACPAREDSQYHYQGSGGRRDGVGGESGSGIEKRRAVKMEIAGGEGYGGERRRNTREGRKTMKNSPGRQTSSPSPCTGTGARSRDERGCASRIRVVRPRRRGCLPWNGSLRARS